MHGSGTLDYLDHLILPNLAVPRHFMTCGRVDGPVGRWAALMTHVFFHVFPIYNKCSLAGNFCSDLFVQSMGLVPLFIPPFKQADYKGTMKKIKLRYCGIIFHASEEKKQCFPMGFHINLDSVAFKGCGEQHEDKPHNAGLCTGFVCSQQHVRDRLPGSGHRPQVAKL